MSYLYHTFSIPVTVIGIGLIMCFSPQYSFAMSYKAQLCYTLNDENVIPAVGYGTARSTGSESFEKALNKALEVGYRHIDTARVYKTEHVIGKVLQEWFSTGKLKREDIFIVTKLPRYAVRASCVEKYLKKSLEALKLDYVDMYLIHTPVGLLENEQGLPSGENVSSSLDFSTDLVGTWKAMEAQVDAGLTKSIGVSNFNQKQIERILTNARIPPANLQVELHIYLQQPELVKFCKNHNIVVTSYSTLRSGGICYKISRVINPPLSVLENPKILEIAEKYGKTPAQIVLRFFLQCGIVVIPSSTNEKRIEENFQVFDFQIDDTDIDELKALDQEEHGRRFVSRKWCPGIEKHPEYPFPL